MAKVAVKISCHKWSQKDTCGERSGCPQACQIFPSADRILRKVNIDRSGANAAGIAAHSAEANATIAARQCRYLNNIVEQDHRFLKQRMRSFVHWPRDRSQSQVRPLTAPRVCDRTGSSHRRAALSFMREVALSGSFGLSGHNAKQ